MWRNPRVLLTEHRGGTIARASSSSRTPSFLTATLSPPAPTADMEWGPQSDRRNQQRSLRSSIHSSDWRARPQAKDGNSQRELVNHIERVSISAGPSSRPSQAIPTAAQIRAQALRNAPQPDLDYLRQAHNTPFAKPTPQKLLLILDLNGTILARPSRRDKRYFVKRPYVDEFLKKCFSKHQVMVWSSARPDTVAHMVQGITTEEQRASLAATWDRSHLRLNPLAYKEKVQVYKCLTWVWEDERVQLTHPGVAQGHFWDQTNTVLIDDSYLKASSEPHNHIEISEFTESMLAEEAETPVLKELLNYLDEASHFEDVSTFIRHHPFEMPKPAISIAT